MLKNSLLSATALPQAGQQSAALSPASVAWEETVSEAKMGGKSKAQTPVSSSDHVKAGWMTLMASVLLGSIWKALWRWLVCLPLVASRADLS